MAFKMPETLPETAAELAELLADATADINLYRARAAVKDPENPLTAADAATLKGLLGHHETIKTAHTAAVAADVAHADELKDLLAEAAQAVDKGVEITDDTNIEADEADTDEAADTATDEAAEDVEPALAAGAKPAKAAKAKPAPAAFAAAKGGPPPADREEAGETGWDMRSDAPGFRTGQGKVDLGTIALGLDSVKTGSRTATRSNRPDKMINNRMFSAQVIASLPRPGKVIDGDDPREVRKALMLATDERTIVGPQGRGSLTAAGGWCAPSEQLYDFCAVPPASDLLSLPEITINRGGIRWPVEPDLSDIFEDFEWFFTETELEAVDGDGNPTAIKQCVEIPCADTFDEIRLNAVGWCVESGILQEQGWPELVEWFMQALTQEHMRALSRRSILNIVSGSGSALVIPPTSVLGSVPSVLNSLALMATNIRLKRGLGRTATIEGIAPSWFFEVLRADLAMRQGSDLFNVGDAEIQGWLTARNIALQFVGDWQTRATALPGDLNTLTWPTTVDVVLYPAGTWFRSMANVIELGVMYPKEQLQVNRFTRMFTEDSLAIGKRCGISALARIPLATNGAVGARQTITLTPSVKTVALATTGTPTGGGFTIKLGGKETASIAYGASAATVKTALVALDDNYGNADFTTSGGALPTAVSITYPSLLGSLTAGTNSLTGGTSPKVTLDGVVLE